MGRATIVVGLRVVGALVRARLRLCPTQPANLIDGRDGIAHGAIGVCDIRGMIALVALHTAR